jgi:hypothetical protein
MRSITFAAPEYLPALAVPAGLLLLCAWRVLRRGRELRVLARRRTVPVRERFGPIGALGFWLCVIAAIAVLVLALARPVSPSAIVRRAGLDVVVLQDASASMRVTDVARAGLSRDDRPVRDRWQRSMSFLRELGDALSWQDDRLALAVFAHIAAPQIRLTADPNTLFFFLDHLHERPPFRLEDDTSWDTNLELGLSWGLRIVEKDEEIRGRSRNATVFVALSDGEAWSGEVARAVSRVTARGAPIHVIGVGTLAGGPLPAVSDASGAPPSPGVSRLERAALQRIASAANGRYFELDRESDRTIAHEIIAAGRRLVPPVAVEDAADQLYWIFLCIAGAFVALGVVVERQRATLAILFATLLAASAFIWPALS